MTSLMMQYQKGFPKHQTKMASRRRSRSGDPSPRRASARERSRSPRSDRPSHSPVHHRGREGGSRTTERSRHHAERARDEWAGTISRHREQDEGRKGREGSSNRRNDRGGDSRSDRGGDSRSDRRGDSKSDRGGDSRSDRGGDSRSDREGYSKSDRRGERRHDRGDNSRHDKDDRRRDRAGDNRHDRRYERGDDSRQGRDDSRHGKGDSRIDRAGDSMHDRGSDKRHDKVDDMHDSGDRKHDKPEGSCNRIPRWTDGGSRRRGDRETAQHEFGVSSSGPAEKAAGKEEPNFGLSGALTADTNTYKGVVIQYSEPEEARIPKIRWRLYPFKGEEALPVLYIHRQSAYLIGRDRQIADIPVDHPSCSKQHCVLQYRLVERPKEDGGVKRVIRPYLIDLQSTNGTYINNQRIDPACYVELKEKDVIKFGFSSREYVLLHEQSVAIRPSPGQEEAATDNAETDQ